MNENLRCFISSTYANDLSLIEEILNNSNVDTFDIYDLAIGESIQQILKRKIRQSDFALFLISGDNQNVIYEIGVCEGLGKSQFIILDKNIEPPFYLNNKLYLRADFSNKEFLNKTILKIVEDFKKTWKKKTKRKIKLTQPQEQYNNEIRTNLKSFLSQIKKLRTNGSGSEMEYLAGEVFKTIRINYVENSSNKDKGADFALWSNELGKIIGNQIIVELKYGQFNSSRLKDMEQQILHYMEKTEVKIGVLIYLDKDGQRHKFNSTLNPLIISYDFEDFVKDLLTDSFENLILSKRNKIAHGIL